MLTSSPWLAQLKERNPYLLQKNEANAIIVGAGIAGVSTAYSLLKHTKLTVLLLDAGRIAHGATGRNGGHIVSEFMQPLTEMVETFGKEQTLDAIRAVESGWELLEDMRETAGISDAYDPCDICIGYNGFFELDKLITELETTSIRAEAGIVDEPILVKADPLLIAQIPLPLQKFLSAVPHSVILNHLKTNEDRFIAAQVAKVGCMNSAHFCDDLVAWMQKKYGDRFSVAEETPIQSITLEKKSAKLQTNDRELAADHVILCTNGYNDIEIFNSGDDAINTHFHESIRGVPEFMIGYVNEGTESAAAICYYDHHDLYYLTRRRFEMNDAEKDTLYCMGIDEGICFDESQKYNFTDIPKSTEKNLTNCIEKTYQGLPNTARHTFTWQGLQGYTPNNMRIVGFEPRNPVLLYNLGCNGIGILPSVYGSKRISQLLSGETLAPSVFDPK